MSDPGPGGGCLLVLLVFIVTWLVTFGVFALVFRLTGGA